MKFLRVLLITLSVLLILALAAVGVALLPSVQTWAARKAIASQPGLNVEIGRVAVGLHRVTVENVVLRQNGLVLHLPSLDAELSVVDAAMDKKIALSRLTAKGWTVDLTAPEATPASTATHPVGKAEKPAETSSASKSPTPAEAFKGVLNQIALPVDLQIDTVDLQGEVTFHPKGSASGRAVIVINGGGLGIGKDSSIAYSATITLSDPASPVNAVAVQGNITGRMATARTFSQLGFTLDASASGPKFPSGVKLSADASAASVAGGETYGATVQSVGKKLFSLEANFPSNAPRLGGVWKLDLRDVDIAPFTLGYPLPSFEAVGAGMFEVTTRFDEIHAGGRIKSTADRLSVFSPALDAIGALGFSSDFDFTLKALTGPETSIRVDSFSATVSGAAPVLAAQAQQAFEFNLVTKELKVADPSADLFSATLQGLPLAWARSFLGPLALTGGDLRGEIAASARSGGVSLRTKSPLTLAGVSLTQAGQPLLNAVDLSLNASADYTQQGWQADLTAVDVRSAGQSLLSLNAKVGQLLGGQNQPLKVTGQFKADLPGLLAQPVASAYAQLSSGKAQGDFTVSMAATKSIQFKLVADNLVAATKETLPKITTDLRADIAADGKITLNVPVTIEQAGRTSDLTINGTALQNATDLVLDGRVTSNLLVLDDLKILTVALPAQPASAAPATPTTPAGPDKVPFWKGISGQLSLSIKKAVYAQQIEVTDVAGTLKLDAGSVKFENVKAGIGQGGTVKISGAVTFDGAAKQPYAMNADLAIAGVDSAPLFRAVAPSRPPTIEGKFDATSKLAGGGDNLDQLISSANGDFQISSKSGVFRGIPLAGDVNDLITKNQSTISAISGMLGVGGGRKEDDIIKTVADVTKYISEIPFDQLSVTLSRGKAVEIELKDFTLISPEARLGGNGTITYVEGQPLLKQTMKLSLTLGARGKFGDALKKIKMIDAKTDNLGYSAFTLPININGSAGSPDGSQLKTALRDALLQLITGGGGGLLDIFGGKKG